MRYPKNHVSTFNFVEYRKERRAKRIALGICTRCDNKAREGSCDCAECINQMRAREKERRAECRIVNKCLRCGSTSRPGMLRCINCSTNSNKINRLTQRDKKTKVLSHYGREGKLQCCWSGCEIVDLDMLTLDHIDDNGAEHRKVYSKSGRGGGTVLYTSLIRNNFPKGFQTLCANHNLKKHIMSLSS